MAQYDQPYANLGLLIGAARKAAGFDRQSDFADKIGASQQAVSRWEAGATRPRQDQIPSLSVALRLSTTRLYEAGNYSVPAEILPDKVTVSFDQDMPVDALSPESFERLVEDLVRFMYPDAKEVRRAGGRGHKQGGIDVFAELGDDRRLTVQCKRAARFGPADVDAAVETQAELANIKILALSRVASPQTAAALRRHTGWQLWDKQDISRFIRDLPRPFRVRLVDAYFPGQRMALLGIPAAGPWQTPDEFFAPFAAKLSAFRHDWSLVGRVSDVDELLGKIRTGEGRIIFLQGVGGVGKSRLLKELVNRLGEEQPGMMVLFASPTEPLTAAAMEDLGSGPKLLVIDDAHDRSDLPMLINYAAQKPIRVVLATRPYALARLRAQAGAFAYADAVDTLTVEPLSFEETKVLAAEILVAYGGSVELAESIALATQDCPLVTVMAARIAATDKLPPDLALDTRSFRDTIMGKFAEVITGNLAGTGDQKAISDILEVISLVQPFGVEDQEFRALVANVTGLEEHVISRLLRLLVDGGVLFRRGHQYRLMPDLLGDFIIERSCLSVDEKLNSLADKVFTVAPRGLLGNILVNLGRLDWRRNSGGASKSYLVDHLWRALRVESDHRDAALDAATAAAYYNPRQALAFAEREIAAGKVFEQLGTILQRVAYHQEFVLQACELLWEMGRDDDRKENQFPGHGIRVLQKLTAVEPDKPISFNRTVVEFGLSLLAHPDAFDHTHSPFDFLTGILSGEGHVDTSDGRTITMRAFAVNYDVVKGLRRQVVDAALGCLVEGSPRAASTAAKFIRDALRYPMGIMGQRTQDSILDKYTLEFQETLEHLREAVTIGNLDPVIIIAIADSISWHVNYAGHGTRAIAREVMAALPSNLEFRTLGALADGWGQIFIGSIDAQSWQNRVNKWIAELCVDIGARYPNPAELFRFINSCLERLATFDIGRDNSSPVLIRQLILTLPDFAEYLVETALEQPDARLSAHLGTALFFYFRSNPQAGREAARRLFDTGNLRFQMSVANAISNPVMDEGRLVPADLEILIRILGSSEKAVVMNGAQVLNRLAEANPRGALDMLRYVNFQGDANLIDYVFMLFHSEQSNVLAAMTTGDVDFLLGQLRDAPELTGHWVETLLSHLSKMFPEQTLRFFMERVDLAAREENFSTMRPVNYGPWVHVPLRFREADRFRQFLDKVWSWLINLDLGSWRYTHNAAALFEAVALPVDSILQEFFTTKIAVANGSELTWIAMVLSHAETDFVFENTDFVIGYLGACDRARRDVRRRAVDALFRSWLSGVRTSIPGEPTHEDVRAVEKTTTLLDRLTPGTSAHGLYQMIREQAQRGIKNAKWDMEQF